MTNTNETTEAKTKPRSSGSLFKRLVIFAAGLCIKHLWLLAAFFGIVNQYFDAGNQIIHVLFVFTCILFFYLSWVCELLLKIGNKA